MWSFIFHFGFFLLLLFHNDENKVNQCKRQPPSFVLLVIVPVFQWKEPRLLMQRIFFFSFKMQTHSRMVPMQAFCLAATNKMSNSIELIDFLSFFFNLSLSLFILLWFQFKYILILRFILSSRAVTTISETGFSIKSVVRDRYSQIMVITMKLYSFNT